MVLIKNLVVPHSDTLLSTTTSCFQSFSQFSIGLTNLQPKPWLLSFTKSRMRHFVKCLLNKRLNKLHLSTWLCQSEFVKQDLALTNSCCARFNKSCFISKSTMYYLFSVILLVCLITIPCFAINSPRNSWICFLLIVLLRQYFPSKYRARVHSNPLPSQIPLLTTGFICVLIILHYHILSYH